jgi:hypothetical protein
MSAPKRPRRKSPAGDAGAIPEHTIEQALPLVAEDYAALIANSPKGEPAPDPKQVVAHYAAAHAILAHLVELSELAGRKTDEPNASATADAALTQARAGMAREADAGASDEDA